MGIAKKTDGRYVVGIGVADANDYKGSAAYRDIFIQLTESGASDKSLDYLNYLKDYAIYHNSLGEPIMPPSVNVWISNHGVTTAVEADDLSLDGSNYTIGGIKWDGSAWDYTNAGQGESGSGLPAYSSSDIGKVLTVGEGGSSTTEVVVPEQTVTVGTPVPKAILTTDYDISTLHNDDLATLTIDGASSVLSWVSDSEGAGFYGEDYSITVVSGVWTLNGLGAFGPGASITVSLTRTIHNAELKWEAAGLPDYSNAEEGATLKIVNGVPTWATT